MYRVKALGACCVWSFMSCTPLVSKTFVLAGVVAMLLTATGCASTMVPLTHELRSQHDLSDQEVQQLQIYLSHTVTMRREVNAKGRTISGGHLKVTAGKTIEEVVVKKHTPGVVIGIDDQVLRVSFEEGSALDFALRGAEIFSKPLIKEPTPEPFAKAPNPFPGQDPGPVEHTHSNADLLGSYWLAMQHDNSYVHFQGKTWEAVQESFRAHLMIDAESLEEVVESRTVLKGRTVGMTSAVRVY